MSERGTDTGLSFSPFFLSFLTIWDAAAAAEGKKRGGLVNFISFFFTSLRTTE